MNNMRIKFNDQNGNPIDFVVDGKQVDSLNLHDIGQIVSELLLHEGKYFDFLEYGSMKVEDDKPVEEKEFSIRDKVTGKLYTLSTDTIDELIDDEGLMVKLLYDLSNITNKIMKDINLEEMFSE